MNRINELPVLIGQNGPLNGQRWPVGQALVIGRDSSCDISIPDRQVSRFHARVTPAEEGIMLEDLGSKNGTYCNGKRVDDPVYIQDSDLIQVALVQNFVFLSSDATMPMQASDQEINQRVTKRLFLDPRSRRVWIGQKEVLPPLSAPQFRFLQVIYEQEGRVVSRQELVTAVWGSDEVQGVSEQALDALARRLRERLHYMDATHTYIVTVRGHGVRLDNPIL